MKQNTQKKKTRRERELAKMIRVTQQKVRAKHPQQNDEREQEQKQSRFYDSSLLHDKSVEDSSADEIFNEMKRRDF